MHWNDAGLSHLHNPDCRAPPLCQAQRRLCFLKGVVTFAGLGVKTGDVFIRELNSDEKAMEKQVCESLSKAGNEYVDEPREPNQNPKPSTMEEPSTHIKPPLRISTRLPEP